MEFDNLYVGCKDNQSKGKIIFNCLFKVLIVQAHCIRLQKKRARIAIGDMKKIVNLQ